MNLLILGGTRFVGRYLAAAALARGHAVTLFNRGLTHPDLFPEAEHLRGDRKSDLSALQGRRWDAAIDVNGYVPRVVRASAAMLAGAVERYIFISTLSVYASFQGTVNTEESPVKQPPPGQESCEEITDESYGWLKVFCERAAEAALPGRVLHVRPCVVAGPHDPSERFPWWVARVARGGEVLAPGRPGRPLQLIDARDLGSWVIDMTERRETGVYNVTGPERPLTMGEMLATCRDVTRSDAAFTWVDDRFLEEHDIEPPLWLPESLKGFNTVDSGKARARGLAFRPLAETVRDTLEWVEEDPGERTPRFIEPEREAELLQLWRAR